MQACPHIDGAFLTLNGDAYLTDALVKQLAGASGPTLAVMPVDDPSAYGVVEHNRGHVTGIVEKSQDPLSNLANVGWFCFTPEIFTAIADTPPSERGEYDHP